MAPRYEVVFSRRDWRTGVWIDTVIARRKSREVAEAKAEAWGDRREELWTTRANYHRDRGRHASLTVRDRKTGKDVWEHPFVIVPSVGERGVW